MAMTTTEAMRADFARCSVATLTALLVKAFRQETCAEGGLR
jgi:hypothetical protein